MVMLQSDCDVVAGWRAQEDFHCGHPTPDGHPQAQRSVCRSSQLTLNRVLIHRKRNKPNAVFNELGNQKLLWPTPRVECNESSELGHQPSAGQAARVASWMPMANAGRVANSVMM
jgi:hypothetical protein